VSETVFACPFCGGSAKVATGLNHFFDGVVTCDDCSAEGPIFDCDDGEADELGRNRIAAIQAWNRRAPL